MNKNISSSASIAELHEWAMSHSLSPSLYDHLKLLDDRRDYCFKCPLCTACNDFQEIAHAELCHFIVTRMGNKEEGNKSSLSKKHTFHYVTMQEVGNRYRLYINKDFQDDVPIAFGDFYNSMFTDVQQCIDNALSYVSRSIERLGCNITNNSLDLYYQETKDLCVKIKEELETIPEILNINDKYRKQKDFY